MLLTLGKRVAFEAAYRLDYPHWTENRFREIYGKKYRQTGSLGGNFDAWFVFNGPVDEASGMMINVADIKSRVGDILAQQYDHKFLNDDNDSFRDNPPTLENIARQLFRDTSELFEDTHAKLYACHLVESPEREVTAYHNRVERHASFQFSAARKTVSPFLSEAENRALFGVAVNDHGHYYDCRVTLNGEVDAESGLIIPEVELDEQLARMVARLDHKLLNKDLPELKEMPLTTEALSRWIFNELSERLPVDRLTLSENPWFTVDYYNEECCRVNLIDHFRAAHRLHSPRLSDKDNLDIFGKCNNPHGHGHRYKLQAGVAGPIDEKSGTVVNLTKLIDGVKRTLFNWDGKFIDRELAAFKSIASTSENIIRVLHDELELALGTELSRLRLWETDNNRFTLRR